MRTGLLWPLAGLVVIVSACAPVIRKMPADAGLLAGQAERELRLAAQRDWAFTGRIGLASQSGGGSGRIEWRQRGEDFEIALSAPVSRQSWRLTREAGQVVLEGLDGGPYRGEDAQRLLWEATGWLIPVDGMIAWVRGARGPGPWDIEFAPGGLPAQLRQGGWEIVYRAWQSDRDPALPARVFASRGEDRVRLHIDEWAPAGPQAAVQLPPAQLVH